MTLNVLGAQASVSGTISVPTYSTVSGEITVMTTAATADYTALVTLSLVATAPGGYGIAGGLTLPGQGGGFGSRGSSVEAIPCSGAAVAPFSGLSNSGVMLASSVCKVGPGTAVKVPYGFYGGSSVATIAYTINAHVAYIKNP